MIRADQMPPETISALWATLQRDGGATMAEALAAGLNAWPGMTYAKWRDYGEADRIVLPVQEVSDE